MKQELFDLQVAEHGTLLRAHLHEQHMLSEARAMEHHVSMKANQNIAATEQRAAIQMQRTLAEESQKAQDLERYYAARLAATNSEAAACAADANARRAEGPRLEAMAAAAAQRLSNSKIVEADRRAAEAASQRELCERLVLKQQSELQEHAARHAGQEAVREQNMLRLQSVEELNSRLSHRLMDAEEANVELRYRLRIQDDAHRKFLDSLRQADPALASQLSGEPLSAEEPSRTAKELEAENLTLRTSLLEATERLEDLGNQTEIIESEYHSALREAHELREARRRPGSRGPTPRPGQSNSARTPRPSLSPRPGMSGSPRQGMQRSTSPGGITRLAVGVPQRQRQDAMSPRVGDSARRSSNASSRSVPSMGIPSARALAETISGKEARGWK